MAAMKHTPWPWTAEAAHSNSITIRAASKSAHQPGWEIATVYNEERDKLTKTMWADARLIAAATFTPHECEDVECPGWRLLKLLREKCPHCNNGIRRIRKGGRKREF